MINVTAITLTPFNREITMNTKDRIGFVIWAAGTSVYRMAGSYFFEGSSAQYWLNVIVTGILYSAVSLGLMKWRCIEPQTRY